MARRGLRQSRAFGVVVSVATYVVAFGVAIVAVHLAKPVHPLLTVAVGDAAATVTVFVASLLANNSSLYDPYWSVKPAVVAGFFLSLTWPEPGARLALATVVVLLYSIRLTGNFYRDWPGLRKEDFRYVAFRLRFPRAYWAVSLVGIHLFPTIMVYLGCLPLYAISQARDPLNALDILGAAVALASIVLALVADAQLRSFRRDPGSADRVINEGLWRLSRHPNYLGEISFWWGLFLLALAGGGRWWWTGVGALSITLMFVYVSIPMMERRLLATRPGYADYARRTPPLLPIGSRRATATSEP